MEIRQDLKDAYRLAKEFAAALKESEGVGEADTRIVTVYDEEDKPWAEFRVVFTDAVPTELKAHIGGTILTKEWSGDEWGLEQMETILSQIDNFFNATYDWLGD